MRTMMLGCRGRGRRLFLYCLTAAIGRSVGGLGDTMLAHCARHRIHPISYAVPARLIVPEGREVVVPKRQVLSPHLPDGYGAVGATGVKRWTFAPTDAGEAAYYRDYAASQFAVTKAKVQSPCRRPRRASATYPRACQPPAHTAPRPTISHTLTRPWP